MPLCAPVPCLHDFFSCFPAPAWNRFLCMRRQRWPLRTMLYCLTKTNPPPPPPPLVDVSSTPDVAKDGDAILLLSVLAGPGGPWLVTWTSFLQLRRLSSCLGWGWFGPPASFSPVLGLLIPFRLSASGLSYFGSAAFRCGPILHPGQAVFSSSQALSNLRGPK